MLAAISRTAPQAAAHARCHAIEAAAVSMPPVYSGTTGPSLAPRRIESEEQNSAGCDVLLLRLFAVPGPRLGVDELAHQRQALGEAVVDTEHTRLVLAHEIARGHAGGQPPCGDAVDLLVAREFELRDTVAHTDLQA